VASFVRVDVAVDLASRFGVFQDRPESGGATSPWRRAHAAASAGFVSSASMAVFMIGHPPATSGCPDQLPPCRRARSGLDRLEAIIEIFGNWSGHPLVAGRVPDQ